MAGNSGLVEPATEGSPETDHQNDEQSLRHHRSSRTTTRHLYIAYSADAPQGTPTMQKQPPAPRTRKSKGMLDRSVQGQIGRMLRDVFVDVAEEPVPERFVKLLEALEAKEKQP